jgi:hypothetical protein
VQQSLKKNTTISPLAVEDVASTAEVQSLVQQSLKKNTTISPLAVEDVASTAEVQSPEEQSLQNFLFDEFFARFDQDWE